MLLNKIGDKPLYLFMRAVNHRADPRIAGCRYIPWGGEETVGNWRVSTPGKIGNLYLVPVDCG